MVDDFDDLDVETYGFDYNFMGHNFIENNDTFSHKCSICNIIIWFGQVNKAGYLGYNIIHNYGTNNSYAGSELNLTCEEYIIKKIIE